MKSPPDGRGVRASVALEALRHKGSRGSSLTLLGTSTIGVGRAGAFPHGEASTTGWTTPLRWSRCEPRAASLETTSADAEFGPPCTGNLSAQQVSRLVSSAPRHLDHRSGKGWGIPAWEGFDHRDGNGPPAGRGVSRVRRASRPLAPKLDSGHDGPETYRHKGSRGSSLALLGTSTTGMGRPSDTTPGVGTVPPMA